MDANIYWIAKISWSPSNWTMSKARELEDWDGESFKGEEFVELVIDDKIDEGAWKNTWVEQKSGGTFWSVSAVKNSGKDYDIGRIQFKIIGSVQRVKRNALTEANKRIIISNYGYIILERRTEKGY